MNLIFMSFFNNLASFPQCLLRLNEPTNDPTGGGCRILYRVGGGGMGMLAQMAQINEQKKGLQHMMIFFPLSLLQF